MFSCDYGAWKNANQYKHSIDLHFFTECIAQMSAILTINLVLNITKHDFLDQHCSVWYNRCVKNRWRAVTACSFALCRAKTWVSIKIRPNSKGIFIAYRLQRFTVSGRKRYFSEQNSWGLQQQKRSRKDFTFIVFFWQTNEARLSSSESGILSDFMYCLLLIR